VIPKALRDRLGILPGDEVDFVLEDGAVRVEPRRGGPDLRGLPTIPRHGTNP
jgi:AbrB family looped-hinge helix DNA binding protein